MRLSKKMDAIKPNILATLEAERRRIIAEGKTVINLSAGTPDLPPDDFAMRIMSEAALEAENYKYAIFDFPELTEAAQSWYGRRFGVSLSAEQITSVYGSQEGISHIFFTLCDPGDVVLVPDPGYPVFEFGPFMAGAEIRRVPLRPENGFLIDFDAIDKSLADKARAMVVSYPNNPTTACANPDFYERLVHFAKKHDIIVVHDNAYSELVLNGEPGGSFLQTKGAADVGIEFNSLSKSYNLTGMRMSFALGNRDIVTAFRTLRSKIDYGPFPCSQHTAIAVLNGPQDILERNRTEYRLRRDTLCAGLREIGWNVPDCDSTMFTWFPIPPSFSDDEAFTLELMKKTGVIGVPGSSFGEMGKGFIRFALVQPPEVLKQAACRIKESGIIAEHAGIGINNI